MESFGVIMQSINGKGLAETKQKERVKFLYHNSFGAYISTMYLCKLEKMISDEPVTTKNKTIEWCT